MNDQPRRARLALRHGMIVIDLRCDIFHGMGLFVFFINHCLFPASFRHDLLHK